MKYSMNVPFSDSSLNDGMYIISTKHRQEIIRQPGQPEAVARLQNHDHYRDAGPRQMQLILCSALRRLRSEERRVGKECRCRVALNDLRKQTVKGWIGRIERLTRR